MSSYMRWYYIKTDIEQYSGIAAANHFELNRINALFLLNDARHWEHWLSYCLLTSMNGSRNATIVSDWRIERFKHRVFLYSRNRYYRTMKFETPSYFQCIDSTDLELYDLIVTSLEQHIDQYIWFDWQ